MAKIYGFAFSNEYSRMRDLSNKAQNSQETLSA